MIVLYNIVNKSSILIENKEVVNMTQKIRLIRTTVVEYEPHLEYYPAGSTIEDAAKIDLQNAEDDPELIFSRLVLDEIKYEIFEE